MTVNKIIIESTDKVGAYSAERDDAFLIKCFFQHPAFGIVREPSNSESILYGNTGSGKTAIIRYLTQVEENVLNVDLDDVTLNYISNSNVVQVLDDLDADTNLLFRAFWQYIIILSYIRLKYRTNNAQKTNIWVDGLAERFRKDKSRSKALKFLEKHRDMFWVDADVAVEEYATRIDNEFRASIGADFISKFRADSGFVRKQGSEKKEQIRRRLTSFINPELLRELNEMMKHLKEDCRPKERVFYITFDRLDENWADEHVKYHLIKSLIECQKSFGGLKDLKIITSMRADIFDRSLALSSDPGSQRDKLRDYKAEIKWSKTQLSTMIGDRVTQLCKRKYTGKKVSFDEIFTKRVDGKAPLDYILERTLMRPRDVILFVNECLTVSSGKSEVGFKDIKKAEEEYSRIRRSAIIDEWKSCIPSISIIIGYLSTLEHPTGKFSDFSDKIDWEDLVVSVFEVGDNNSNCQVFKVISRKGFDIDKTSDRKRLVSLVLSELYRVGAIGLKANENTEYRYVYDGPTFIDASEVSEDSHWFIHRGLRSTLGFTNRKNKTHS